MVAGKQAHVFDYGNLGKDSAHSLRAIDAAD